MYCGKPQSNYASRILNDKHTFKLFQNNMIVLHTCNRSKCFTTAVKKYIFKFLSNLLKQFFKGILRK